MLLGPGGAVAGAGEAGAAGGGVGAGDFAGELFEESHAEGGVLKEGAVEGVEGELEDGAGSEGNERAGMEGIAEGGGELDEVSGSDLAEGEAGFNALGLSLKESGHNEIEAMAGGALTEDDVARGEVEALRGGVEHGRNRCRTVEQLCERTRRQDIGRSEARLRLHFCLRVQRTRIRPSGGRKRRPAAGERRVQTSTAS